MTQGRKQHRELTLGRAVPAQRSTRRPCGETSQSSQAARTGEQRRRARRRREKFRPGRDLHDPGPARPRDRARQFPRHQSGWSMFFTLLSSFSRESRETEFTKVVSEEIATARSRHASRRRIPMPANPRHRTRRNRHEARAGIVALISCCLVRLSDGRLGPHDEIALIFCVHAAKDSPWCRFGEPPGSTGLQW